MKQTIEEFLQSLSESTETSVEKLSKIISKIRPKSIRNKKESIENIEVMIQYLEAYPEFRESLSSEFNLWLINSKISNNIASLGILSKQGFKEEISDRFYNKFLPQAPQKGDFSSLFAILFPHKKDPLWVNAIGDALWAKFWGMLLYNEALHVKTKTYLYHEIVYATEILAIWIAAEEFDEHYIRLDRSLLTKDSAFIALQREISSLACTVQNEDPEAEFSRLDFQHIDVLIAQCYDQVNFLRKQSLNKGILVSLTYNLERLEQIIQRTQKCVQLIQEFETDSFYATLLPLFKEVVEKNCSRNSLSEVLNQNIKILAKSIANNASEHGEHYIADTTKEYIGMFLSASGAGIVIALMALIKITIMHSGFSPIIETILASLNYGFGFVLIHLLGFTVATKQPAMTASTFAKAVDRADTKRADQHKLATLFMQVSRSQFAAVVGNVTLALGVSCLIGFIYAQNHIPILSPQELQYYTENFNPFPGLFYAAIAGIWLFTSGLIAGYYDNRASYLDLKSRYMHLPILKKITSWAVREKIATYLHNNHGAIMGNFYFGILLGVTPFVGHMLDLPLDIRHVAFSSANLGYIVAQGELSLFDFIEGLIFVLMIGLVNLSVSFALALKVSLKSRDAYFGNFFSFVKLLFQEAKRNPRALFFPPKKVEES
jgi:site-specific recombinase